MSLPAMPARRPSAGSRARATSRATQVAAGRAWVRLQLAAGALGVALQPHSQALQEYPEMAALRAAMRAETGVAR